MRRAERIEIRATEEQKARWTAAAGGDLSAWIRDTLDAEAASSTPSVPSRDVQHHVAAPKSEPAKKAALAPEIVSAATRAAGSSAGCPMFVPRGTRCRVCGKTH
jgi:hypothetical protein